MPQHSDYVYWSDTIGRNLVQHLQCTLNNLCLGHDL